MAQVLMFIQLDSENRLIGFRSGHYTIADKFANEVVFNGSLDFNSNRFCVYNSATNTFTKDTKSQELLTAYFASLPVMLEPFMLKQKFTLAEKSKIFELITTDPIINDFWQSLQDQRTPIFDMKSPQVVEMLDYLVQRLVITEARKAEFQQNPMLTA